MATITATWTENQSLRASGSLAAGASESNSIDVNDDATVGGADTVVIQVSITIGSSTSATVEVFGSADSGATTDTFPVDSYEVSADDVRTVTIPDYPYITVTVTNNDGTNAVTDLTIIYAARQWNSA